MIEDVQSFQEIQSKLTGEAIHMCFVQNRDPRVITDKPSLILLKSSSLHLSRVAAFFPDKLEPALVKSIFEYVGRVPIATRGVAALKRMMVEHELKGAGVIDLQAAAMTYAKGKSEQTVSNWVWGCQWCPIALAEWFTPPLDRDQSYHLAYYMDLTSAFIKKVGLPNLAVKKSY